MKKLLILPTPQPEVSPEDHKLIMMLCDEYNLPFDELCWLIINTRYLLTDRFKPILEHDLQAFEKYSNSLFAPDTEIREISITTNKGKVNFDPSDSLFSYFKSPIDKIKENIKKQDTSSVDHFNRMSIEMAFQAIAFYFYNTKLSDDQILVAIGRILAHLKFMKGAPILTKEERESGPLDAYRSYNNYLTGRVKPLLKKYKPRYFTL